LFKSQRFQKERLKAFGKHICTFELNKYVKTHQNVKIIKFNVIFSSPKVLTKVQIDAVNVKKYILRKLA
jgi:hypothetical protein